MTTTKKYSDIDTTNIFSLTKTAVQHVYEPHHHDSDATDVFGFWVYIMSDCMLFATLFAAFAVLHTHTFGGPPLKSLISLPYILGETLFLLVSNLVFGFSMLRLYAGRADQAMFWLALAFLLGAGFVAMEINEFIHLFHEGHGFQSSAAMSAFFTLVGTHGLHVSIGLLWIIIMLIQLNLFKVNRNTVRRMTYLGVFWNFLDIVWIFLFTMVYLMELI